MRQKLLKDVLIVFAVWFAIGYYASGLPVSLAPDVAKGVVMIWIVGGCAGVCAAWTHRRWGVRRAQTSIAGAGVSDGNASAAIMDGDEARTLYEVALPVPPPPKMGSAAGNPMHKLAWWSKYALTHPEHAAVINDVYGIMQSRPGLQAGIDFHQGATLVEHSMDVVNKLLELAPGWTCDGLKNSAGAIIAPVQGADGLPHTFGEGTAIAAPVLPIAAFAHDIGKVVCLVEDDRGNPVMLHGHGLKGAEILRTLPSVAALPMEDRDALLIAVKYYHALTHIPLAQWIGDEARSLAALLYTADSQSEFNRARDTTLQAPSPAEQACVGAAETPAPDTQVMSGPEALDAPDDKRYVTDSGATPLDAMLDALAEVENINSKAVGRRLGWKYGAWVYIVVDQFLPWAAIRMEDPALRTGGARQTLFMDTLLTTLAAHGWLYLGAPARSPADAVWKAASSSNNDISASRSYEAIVIGVAAADHLANIEDCRYAPLLLDKDAGALAQPMVASVGGQEAEDDGGQELVAGSASEVDILADFDGRSAFDEPNWLDKVDEAKKCDTVALRRNEKGEVHHGKRPLTASILTGYAKAQTAMYGHDTFERNGFEFHLFDVELLEASFAFNTKELPAGIVARVGEKDGKLKLVVAP